MIPKKLSREVIYESEWLSLYADRVQFSDGYILDKYHFAHFDFDSVGIVVLNNNTEVLLIKSNRYLTQSEEWEIPAGRVDKGESLWDAAVRETLEETGYTISEPNLVYKYNPSIGSSDQVFAIFKAVAIEKEEDFDKNEVAEIAWVSRDRIMEMLKQNDIRCGFSLTGLMLVLFCGL